MQIEQQSERFKQPAGSRAADALIDDQHAMPARRDIVVQLFMNPPNAPVNRWPFFGDFACQFIGDVGQQLLGGHLRKHDLHQRLIGRRQLPRECLNQQCLARPAGPINSAASRLFSIA